jgi:hypothetical protein
VRQVSYAAGVAADGGREKTNALSYHNSTLNDFKHTSSCSTNQGRGMRDTGGAGRAVSTWKGRAPYPPPPTRLLQHPLPRRAAGPSSLQGQPPQPLGSWATAWASLSGGGSGSGGPPMVGPTSAAWAATREWLFERYPRLLAAARTFGYPLQASAVARRGRKAGRGASRGAVLLCSAGLLGGLRRAGRVVLALTGFWYCTSDACVVRLTRVSYRRFGCPITRRSCTVTWPSHLVRRPTAG